MSSRLQRKPLTLMLEPGDDLDRDRVVTTLRGAHDPMTSSEVRDAVQLPIPPGYIATAKVNRLLRKAEDCGFVQRLGKRGRDVLWVAT